MSLTSALHVACYWLEVDIVRLLLAYGADFTACDAVRSPPHSVTPSHPPDRTAPLEEASHRRPFAEDRPVSAAAPQNERTPMWYALTASRNMSAAKLSQRRNFVVRRRAPTALPRYGGPHTAAHRGGPLSPLLSP